MKARRAKLLAMLAALSFGASACQIPVNPSDFGITLPVSCTLYVLEPAAGALIIPISAGVAEVGCNLTF